jgi:hypothetical protein
MLRSMSLRRVLPWLAIVVWVAAVAGVVAVMSGGDVFFSAVIAMPGYGTVGAFLGIRRPTHPVGWLLLAMGALPVFAGLMEMEPPIINGLALAGLAVVLVVFPTGRPLSRRWLIPIGIGVVSWVFLWDLPLVPLAGGVEVGFSVVLTMLSLLACASAPLIRFRRSSGIERAQLRWLGSAVAAMVLAAVVTAIGLAGGMAPLVDLGGSFTAMLAGFGLPIAIMIAILRYRLFEIGKIVSRTVTYAIVAALVAAVYAVPVVLAPQILGTSSAAVTAAATLAAVAAFSPLRRRVRAAVDRRFNRSAYDAAREVERFAAEVRDLVDPDVIARRLGDVVGSVLHPNGQAVWLQRQG